MHPFSWLAGLPPWLMFAGFLALAVVRGWAYYAVGALGGSRAGGARWTQARQRVRDLGPRAVVVTWPVYGLAAATQVASGAARVSRWGFGWALLLMSILWAGLQTVLGVALLEALVSDAAPVIAGLLALLVLGRLALSRWRQGGPAAVAGA